MTSNRTNRTERTDKNESYDEKQSASFVKTKKIEDINKEKKLSLETN